MIGGGETRRDSLKKGMQLADNRKQLRDVGDCSGIREVILTGAKARCEQGGFLSASHFRGPLWQISPGLWKEIWTGFLHPLNTYLGMPTLPGRVPSTGAARATLRDCNAGGRRKQKSKRATKLQAGPQLTFFPHGECRAAH